MKRRERKNRADRFRKALQFELLEARTLLASDLTNPILIEGREAVRNELLIQYLPQTQATQRNSAAVAASVTVAETIHTKTMQATGAGVLERVILNPGVDMQTAMKALKQNPNVLYVEPNYIYRTTAVSNDPSYTNGSLWGMYSNDSPTAAGPAGTTNQFGSQAEKAWNDGITGNSNVIIGVVDEGIQFNHPDLIDNMWLNPFETAGDGIDNDGNGYIDDIRGWDFANNDNTVYDGTGDDHGTHCAGTIGATGGNGIGVAGVAWDVTMISAKFLGSSGGTSANAVRAIDYVTDLKNRHALNIVATSNSWGGGGFSQSLLDAITRGANRNILFVAAAGNGGTDSVGDDNDTLPFYPATYSTTAGAGYDAVISVAAITSSGSISSFSNFGDVTVDIGAPGSGILSTVPSNTYASYNGTSMATPHVSGAIALYASSQPVGVSAASIRQAILQSATPTASLAGKTVTGARLNVYEAVRPKQGIQVSAPSPSAITTEAGSSITFTVVLASAPTANVTIPVSSSDATEGTVSTNALVFTATNWSTAQTVTVTGVNDSIVDGNINYAIILGAAVSSDTGYSGRNPNDISLTNQDDDTLGIIVSPPSGTTTTELGGTVTFTVRLNSEPTANVSIALSSSDTTEGTVNLASVVFTAANWNVAQTVSVRGVDDLVYDGNVAYTVLLWPASSSDALYNGINPADISLTNLDNEPIPTKFFVVNDASTNRTYEYDSGGGAIENYSLASANSTPRGVATNVAGDRVWVVDSNRTVYVYNNSGGLLGSWAAGGMPSNAVVEGVTTNGTHIWIVESGGDRVYYYPNAASRVSGTQSATSNFLLSGSNRNPKDLVTDGSSIWVVNDTTSDRVFRYSVSGTLQNSWAINSANATPTGITLDPSNGSQDIWIVDSGTDRVYRYANARTLSSPVLTSFFPLAAGNTDPTGIADPPAGEAMAQFEVFVDGTAEMPLERTAESVLTAGNDGKSRNAPTNSSELLQQTWGASRESVGRVVALASMSGQSRVVLPARIDLAISSIFGSKNSASRAKPGKPSVEDLRDDVFADWRSDLA